MTKKIDPNISNRARIGFYAIGVACGLVAAALLVHIVLSYRSGAAFAYVSSRAQSVLEVALRATDPSQFWFFLGAWGLAALLFLYLSFRFIQLARRIGYRLKISKGDHS